MPEPDDSSLDARLIELETRLAFQDETIQQLNDVIVAQQQRLDTQEKLLKMLLEQMRAVLEQAAESGSGDGGHEVPPHY